MVTSHESSRRTWIAFAILRPSEEEPTNSVGRSRDIDAPKGGGVEFGTYNGSADPRHPRNKQRLRSGCPLQPLVGPRFAGQPVDDYPRGLLSRRFASSQRLRSGADGTRSGPDVTCNVLLALLSADALHDRGHAGMVSALTDFPLKFTK